MVVAAFIWSFDTLRYQFSAERVEATVSRSEEISEVVDPDTGRTQMFLDVDLSYDGPEGEPIVEQRVFPLWHGYKEGDVLDYRYFPGLVNSGRVFNSMTLVWPTALLIVTALIATVAVVFGREANRSYR